jgi:hypothetical protein
MRSNGRGAARGELTAKTRRARGSSDYPAGLLTAEGGHGIERSRRGAGGTDGKDTPGAWVE